MKLSCLFLGHDWLPPTWESHELREHCARCSTKRSMVSTDSFFAQLDLRSLLTLPTDISLAALENTLRKRRDGDFARRWLTGLGLYGDAAGTASVPPEMIPTAWLPWIRFALAELAPSTKLDPECIEKFFSTFARKAALPFLVDMANCEFRLLGEQLAETVVAAKELSLERRKQFMYGNWQDAAECADVIVDTYTVETVHARYQPKRPIAAGAQKALRRLCDKDPTLQLTIDPTLFASDPPLPVEQELTRQVWVKSVEKRALAHC